MEKKDIKVLKEVMSHGTHEGRMYALTALYYIDRKIYADVVSPFKKSRQEVQCGNGCVVTWRKMRDIIRNLEKGDYDVISKSKS